MSAELSELGTAGIREFESSAQTVLLAGFEVRSDELLRRFDRFSPEWEEEEAIDWVQHTHDAWPAREVGENLFLAPPWSSETTPPGRVRVLHNPGLASGTGEHPCTQLALAALEQCVTAGCTVTDVGTGSGILAIAAAKLGASRVIAVDTDDVSVQTARENFALNDLNAFLVKGSADCIATAACDVTIANINASVLLAITDELMRITKAGGKLILTGFPEWELRGLESLFEDGRVTEMNEWRCAVFSS